MAVSLQQAQGEAPGALSDLELAQRLQQEEYQQQQQQQQLAPQQPPTPPPAAAAPPQAASQVTQRPHPLIRTLASPVS